MSGRLRVYLDTSVLSAHVDARELMRQELTRQFWQRPSAYEGCVSPLVLEEVGNTPDTARRQEMLALAQPLSVLAWQPEMDRLAQSYVAGGAFTPALQQDARHVAACSVASVPILLSWNFRHLVNRTRRIRVNLINSQEGYGQLEILAPPELE